MKILFKLASRSRPDRLISSLHYLYENAESGDFNVLLSLDEDDETVNNEAFKGALALFDGMSHLHRNKLIIRWGRSTSKVDAINRDLNDHEILMGYRPDLILCHSDDMFFIKNGFDNDIREAFEGFSGLVHFPDQQIGNRLCTYSMMDLAYYLEFNYIYHPAYKSVFCDNEAHAVAVMRNQYKFVDKKILEHRHPIWGYGKADALLNHTESFYAEDLRTFQLRQANNFA